MPEDSKKSIEETKRSIEERLGKSELKYLKRLNKIKGKVKDLWIDKKYLPEYFTFHDGSHSAEVENSIYKLIPQENIYRLSDQDLFCLIAAAWLHDVGMIPDAKTHNLLEDNISKSLIRTILSEKYIDQENEYINLLLAGDSNTYREVHQLLSKKYVKDNFQYLGLYPNEAGIIADLCQYHRKSEDISSLNTKNLQILAAYLRLADAIHINPNRVDKDLLTLFERIGMPSESILHWLKNLCTSQVIVDNENQLITIEINADEETGPKDMLLIADYIREDIESELESVRDILARGNISYYSEVRAELIRAVFSQRDKILVDQIISKLQLRDKSSASDVIDSVIKSIIYILDLPDTERNKHSMVKWYLENVIGELLSKRPCHILVRRIFGLIQEDIGKDISTLSESQIKEILKSTKFNIERFRDNRKLCLNKLFEHTKSILSDMGTILLFGHSRLVIKALCGIDEKIRAKTVIYICEGRNIGRYNSLNELEYSDGVEYASSLTNHEFKEIILVPDILVGSLMSRSLIDKVIFGANGVDMSDGTFGHSAGHLTIADLAYLYDIPVYVILDSFKFGDLKSCFNSKLERNEDRKYEWLSADKKVLSRLTGVRFFNPREDLIQGELNGRNLKRFTALITDYGIIQANRIPEEISEGIRLLMH